MKSKIVYFLSDLKHKFCLSFRLWMHDRMTAVIFVISGIIFLGLLGFLNQEADDASRLPIGVVNLDITDDSMPSELAEEFLNNLSQSRLLRIETGSIQQIRESYRLGKINCYFVIEQGYDENVRTGKVRRLISVYSAEGDSVPLMLSDIMAGYMMEQICRYQAYARYEALDWPAGQKLSEEDYVKLAKDELADEVLSYGFDINTDDAGEVTIDYERLDHSAFYRQVIAGIFALLVSFVLLFSYSGLCIEKTKMIQTRMEVSGMNRIACHLGTILASIFASGILCLFFSAGLAIKFRSVMTGVRIFSAAIIYVLIMALILYMISMLSTSILAYQITASVIVLALGILGFISALDGLILNNFLNVLKNTPNGWFIHQFIDIIVQ